jgi:hypothetical protein
MSATNPIMALGHDSSNKHLIVQIGRVVGLGRIDQLKTGDYWYVQASIYTRCKVYMSLSDWEIREQ